MRRTSPFPFLSELETPLRDAMRGVASFAEATEEALEPAAKLLPEPLRKGFERAIRSIETTGKQLIDRPVEQEQIVAAADFATGAAPAAIAGRDFAKVFCTAWEHTQQTADAPRYLISETIVTTRVMQLPATLTGAACAAEILFKIRSSAAIGRMPGIAEGLRAEERAEIDLALTAIMLWLLSARADTVADEFALIDLAVALVAAIRCDVLGAMEDPARVADLLHNTSAHL